MLKLLSLVTVLLKNHRITTETLDQRYSNLRATQILLVEKFKRKPALTKPFTLPLTIFKSVHPAHGLSYAYIYSSIRFTELRRQHFLLVSDNNLQHKFH